MRERPIAVLIFGILNILFALFDFFGALVSQAMRNIGASGNAAFKAMNSDPAFALWTRVDTVYTVVIAIVLLVSGIGLLLLQNWARILALVYGGIQIVEVFFSAYFSRIAVKAAISQAHVKIAPEMVGALILLVLVVGTLFKLAYPVLVLIFMTRPKVSQAFQAVPTTPDVQRV